MAENMLSRREKLRGEAYRIWMDIFGGTEVHPIDRRGIEKFCDWAERLMAEAVAERDAEWEQAKRLGCDHLPACTAETLAGEGARLGRLSIPIPGPDIPADREACAPSRSRIGG